MQQLPEEKEFYLRRFVDWHAESPTRATFLRTCIPQVLLLMGIGVAVLLSRIYILAPMFHPYFVYFGWFALGEMWGMAQMFWIYRKDDTFDQWPVIENLIDSERLATAARQLPDKPDKPGQRFRWAGGRE